MHRTLSPSFVIMLLLSGSAFAQSPPGGSLGDVARANLAKQQTQLASGTTPKVITNQDLPPATPGIPEASSADPMTQVSGVKRPDFPADRRLGNRLLAEQRAGEQWKARIQEQESRIADLQARIDRMNASIHNSVGTAQYETPVNRSQAIQLSRLATMQETLDQQKQKLAVMQDAARHAGAYQ